MLCSVQFYISLQDEEKQDASSILTDILWLFELSEVGTGRKKLASLVGLVHRENFVSGPLLCERLEAELLEEAGILPSAQVFQRKLIRMNTAMLYKQQKFNLFREEPQGFAKLMSLLWHAELGEEEILYEKLLSLVGCFDLDPNRVLDVIIDVYAVRLRTHHSLYEYLLGKLDYPSDNVANILGFKLSFLAGKTELSSSGMMEGIILVAARLVKLRMCAFEILYHHLSPLDDEQVIDDIRQYQKRIRSSASSAISLASKPSAAPSAAPSATDDSAKQLALEHQPTVRDISAEIQKALGPIVNQKILLLASLLEVGQWEWAHHLLNRFSQAATFPLVAVHLNSVMNVIVDMQLGRTTHLESFIDLQREDFSFFTQRSFEETLAEWLGFVRWGLYLDPSLISKLCRMIRDQLSPANTDEEKKEGWLQLFVNSILSSISLVTSNPGMIFDVWGVLSLFPYSKRHAIYAFWRDQIYSTGPELSVARSMALSDIRRVLRRLTRENVRQYGRLIAKIAHANPIVVFPVILDQLMAYDNLIQPVVDSLKYLTPLGFDVLGFVLIDCLSSPERDRLKEDGTNMASWLQGLATFVGSLYRRYHAVAEIDAIIDYLLRQLSWESPFELIVISELIHRMGGIEALSSSSLSEAHIEAMAAGPLLLSEVLHNASASHNQVLKSNKRAYTRLIQTLVKNDQLLVLWILLAQQRGVASFSSDLSSHLKLIGTVLDTGQGVFLQYSQLLAQGLRDGLIAGDGSLPSIDELMKEYAIEADLACSIHRTWLRSSFTASSNIVLFDIPSPNESLSPKLYSIFWSLQLGDIYTPSPTYLNETMRLKTILSSPTAPTNEGELSKWKKDRERAPQTILKLEAEHQAQMENVQRNIDSLKSELNLVIPSDPSLVTNCYKYFYSKCLLIRTLFSPMDAIYSSRFVKLLHSVNERFSLPTLLDEIASMMKDVLFILSEQEAHNFGRFLELILVETSAWHSDKSKYPHREEGESKAGGQTEALSKSDEMDTNGDDLANGDATLTDDNEADVGNVESMDNEREEADIDKSQRRDDDDGEQLLHSVETAMVVDQSSPKERKPINDWEEYRHWYFRLHQRLLRIFSRALISEDTSYPEIRNTIIILTRIASYFPLLTTHSSELTRITTEVRETEKREDLKVMAARYSAMLSLGQSKMLRDHEFHQVENVPPMEGGEHGEIEAEQSVKSSHSNLSSPSRKRAAPETEGPGGHKRTAVENLRHRSRAEGGAARTLSRPSDKEILRGGGERDPGRYDERDMARSIQGIRLSDRDTANNIGGRAVSFAGNRDRGVDESFREREARFQAVASREREKERGDWAVERDREKERDRGDHSRELRPERSTMREARERDRTAAGSNGREREREREKERERERERRDRRDLRRW